MTISEESIRARAYEIWEREGQPGGRDAEHWQMAVDELTAEAAKAAKPKAPRRTTKAAADKPAKAAADKSAKAPAAKPAAAKPAASRSRKTKAG